MRSQLGHDAPARWFEPHLEPAEALKRGLDA
jgi:hypothetical protein